MDRAIDNVSRHLVGKWLSLYHDYWILRDSSPPLTVVGLFEDLFKEQISTQSPAPDHNAKIIKRLMEFDACEIVLDMRIGDRCTPAEESLMQALDEACFKNIPVILPFKSNEAVECLNRSA